MADYDLEYYRQLGEEIENGAPPLDWAQESAKRAGLPEEFWRYALRRETGGTTNPIQAVSPAGAFGTAQLMPGTAQEISQKYNIDTTSPWGNVLGGAHYMKEQLDRAAGWAPEDPELQHRLALAAYNAGPGRVGKEVQKFRSSGQPLTWEEFSKGLPGETRSYAGKYTHSTVAPGSATLPPPPASLAQPPPSLPPPPAASEGNFGKALRGASELVGKVREFDLIPGEWGAPGPEFQPVQAFSDAMGYLKGKAEENVYRPVAEALGVGYGPEQTLGGAVGDPVQKKLLEAGAPAPVAGLAGAGTAFFTDMYTDPTYWGLEALGGVVGGVIGSALGGVGAVPGSAIGSTLFGLGGKIAQNLPRLASGLVTGQKWLGRGFRTQMGLGAAEELPKGLADILQDPHHVGGWRTLGEGGLSGWYATHDFLRKPASQTGRVKVSEVGQDGGFYPMDPARAKEILSLGDGAFAKLGDMIDSRVQKFWTGLADQGWTPRTALPEFHHVWNEGEAPRFRGISETGEQFGRIGIDIGHLVADLQTLPPEQRAQGLLKIIDHVAAEEVAHLLRQSGMPHNENLPVEFRKAMSELKRQADFSAENPLSYEEFARERARLMQEHGVTPEDIWGDQYSQARAVVDAVTGENVTGRRVGEHLAELAGLDPEQFTRELLANPKETLAKYDFTGLNKLIEGATKATVQLQQRTLGRIFPILGNVQRTPEEIIARTGGAGLHDVLPPPPGMKLEPGEYAGKAGEAPMRAEGEEGFGKGGRPGSKKGRRGFAVFAPQRKPDEVAPRSIAEAPEYAAGIRKGRKIPGQVPTFEAPTTGVPPEAHFEPKPSEVRTHPTRPELEALFAATNLKAEPSMEKPSPSAVKRGLRDQGGKTLTAQEAIERAKRMKAEGEEGEAPRKSIDELIEEAKQRSKEHPVSAAPNQAEIDKAHEEMLSREEINRRYLEGLKTPEARRPAGRRTITAEEAMKRGGPQGLSLEEALREARMTGLQGRPKTRQGMTAGEAIQRGGSETPEQTKARIKREAKKIAPTAPKEKRFGPGTKTLSAQDVLGKKLRQKPFRQVLRRTEAERKAEERQHEFEVTSTAPDGEVQTHLVQNRAEISALRHDMPKGTKFEVKKMKAEGEEFDFAEEVRFRMEKGADPKKESVKFQVQNLINRFKDGLITREQLANGIKRVQAPKEVKKELPPPPAVKRITQESLLPVGRKEPVAFKEEPTHKIIQPEQQEAKLGASTAKAGSRMEAFGPWGHLTREQRKVRREARKVTERILKLSPQEEAEQKLRAEMIKKERNTFTPDEAMEMIFRHLGVTATARLTPERLKKLEERKDIPSWEAEEVAKSLPVRKTDLTPEQIKEIRESLGAKPTTEVILRAIRKAMGMPEAPAPRTKMTTGPRRNLRKEFWEQFNREVAEYQRKKAEKEKPEEEITKDMLKPGAILRFKAEGEEDVGRKKKWNPLEISYRARKFFEEYKGPAKQPADAWLRTLTNPKYGIKKDVLEWTGIKDFLESQLERQGPGLKRPPNISVDTLRRLYEENAGMVEPRARELEPSVPHPLRSKAMDLRQQIESQDNQFSERLVHDPVVRDIAQRHHTDPLLGRIMDALSVRPRDFQDQQIDPIELIRGILVGAHVNPDVPVHYEVQGFDRFARQVLEYRRSTSPNKKFSAEYDSRVKKLAEEILDEIANGDTQQVNAMREELIQHGKNIDAYNKIRQEMADAGVHTMDEAFRMGGAKYWELMRKRIEGPRAETEQLPPPPGYREALLSTEIPLESNREHLRRHGVAPGKHLERGLAVSPGDTTEHYESQMSKTYKVDLKKSTLAETPGREDEGHMWTSEKGRGLTADVTYATHEVPGKGKVTELIEGQTDYFQGIRDETNRYWRSLLKQSMEVERADIADNPTFQAYQKKWFEWATSKDAQGRLEIYRDNLERKLTQMVGDAREVPDGKIDLPDPVWDLLNGSRGIHLEDVKPGAGKVTLLKAIGMTGTSHPTNKQFEEMVRRALDFVDQTHDEVSKQTKALKEELRPLESAGRKIIESNPEMERYLRDLTYDTRTGTPIDRPPEPKLPFSEHAQELMAKQLVLAAIKEGSTVIRVPLGLSTSYRWSKPLKSFLDHYKAIAAHVERDLKSMGVKYEKVTPETPPSAERGRRLSLGKETAVTGHRENFHEFRLEKPIPREASKKMMFAEGEQGMRSEAEAGYPPYPADRAPEWLRSPALKRQRGILRKELKGTDLEKASWEDIKKAFFEGKLSKDASDATNRLINLGAQAPEIERLPGVKGPEWDKTWEILGAPRAFITSMDLSYLMRQGMIGTAGMLARGQWAKLGKAIGASVKSLASEEVHKQAMKELETRDDFQTLRSLGIDFAKSEEQFAGARYAERILKKLHVPNFVRGSERAFTYFLNRMRYDLGKHHLDNLRRMGFKDGAELAYSESGKPYVKFTGKDAKLFERAAQWVNIATGRGGLPQGPGRLAKVVRSADGFLNAVLFSPRLMYGRMALFNPWTYVRGYSAAREAGHGVTKSARAAIALHAMDMIGYMGLMTAIRSGLLALSDDADWETDLTSSDYGQVRFGNTRVDVSGGTRTYVTALARLATSSTKTEYGTVKYQSQWDTLTNFLRGKLSPTVGVAVNLAANANLVGESQYSHLADVIKGNTPLDDRAIKDIVKETGGQLSTQIAIPMIIADAVKLQQEHGWDPQMILPLMAGMVLGVGVSTREPIEGMSKSLANTMRADIVSPMNRLTKIDTGVTNLLGEPISHELTARQQEDLKKLVDKPFYEIMSELAERPSFKTLPPEAQRIALISILATAQEIRQVRGLGVVGREKLRAKVQEELVPEEFSRLKPPPAYAAGKNKRWTDTSRWTWRGDGS